MLDIKIFYLLNGPNLKILLCSCFFVIISMNTLLNAKWGGRRVLFFESIKRYDPHHQEWKCRAEIGDVVGRLEDECPFIRIHSESEGNERGGYKDGC